MEINVNGSFLGRHELVIGLVLNLKVETELISISQLGV